MKRRQEEGEIDIARKGKAKKWKRPTPTREGGEEKIFVMKGGVAGPVDRIRRKNFAKDRWPFEGNHRSSAIISLSVAGRKVRLMEGRKKKVPFISSKGIRDLLKGAILRGKRPRFRTSFKGGGEVPSLPDETTKKMKKGGVGHDEKRGAKV